MYLSLVIPGGDFLGASLADVNWRLRQEGPRHTVSLASGEVFTGAVVQVLSFRADLHFVPHAGCFQPISDIADELVFFRHQPLWFHLLRDLVFDI